MRRRKIGQLTLSPRIPTSKNRMDYTTLEIADCLVEFSKNFLRAAVDITLTKVPLGYINVSDEFTAFALRLMVENNGESGMLKVNVSGDTSFNIEAAFTNSLPDKEAVADIFAAAHLAGFSVNISDNTITLAATVNMNKTSIFAPRPDRFNRVLYNIFFA